MFFYRVGAAVGLFFLRARTHLVGLFCACFFILYGWGGAGSLFSYGSDLIFLVYERLLC